MGEIQLPVHRKVEETKKNERKNRIFEEKTVNGLKNTLFEAEKQRKAEREDKKGVVCATMAKNIVFRDRGRGFCSRAGKSHAGERSKPETSAIRAILQTECRGK